MLGEVSFYIFCTLDLFLFRLQLSTEQVRKLFGTDPDVPSWPRCLLDGTVFDPAADCAFGHPDKLCDLCNGEEGLRWH